MVPDKKIQKSVNVLREANWKFDNPTIAWAGGKDSTLLIYLTRQSFPGKMFPFDIIFLDTTFQFQETHNFMDRVARMWDLEYDKVRNEEALQEGVNPWDYSKFECCNRLKTRNLKKAIRERDIDALITGIRWDEHKIRGKDYHFSKRENPCHTRVHPLANLTESEIWEYTRENDLPTNPLYERGFSSLGCWPCTEPSDENEDERAGRAQDKEKVMERLRALGYLIVL